MKLRNRFTLVELLVVIIIIIMLASMFLPSLTRARGQARKANCLSNLKQIYLIARMYCDDQKYYPDAVLQGAGSAKYYWCGYYDGTSLDYGKGPLGDYLKSPDIFNCPEFIFRADIIPLDPARQVSCSYGINAEYVGGSPAPTEQETLDSRAAKATEINSPEKTLFFMDSAVAPGSGYGESYYFWARFSYTTGATHEARTHFRHYGSAVGVFCDGHIEDNLVPDAVDSPTLKIGWPELKICERH
ncbi:MAG: hypothetical protein WCS96_12915 [Victivallales bacterium]|jgi:prepilin-type processing-associated H-X9-DG protein